MSHPSSPPRYWFPAKRYGWGWGPPSCWQGWVVLIVYLSMIVTITPLIAAHAGKADCLLFVGGLTMVLLYIVYKKGEPPSWRWGD